MESKKRYLPSFFNWVFKEKSFWIVYVILVIYGTIFDTSGLDLILDYGSFGLFLVFAIQMIFNLFYFFIIYLIVKSNFKRYKYGKINS